MPEHAPSNHVSATPTFDELFDCARKLGTCEVVLERVANERRLVLVIRAIHDGRAVHRAVVRSSVEDAATRIRKQLERRGAQTGERG